ncbi:MAG: hypothetical protein ORN52_11370 [Beijerinckiaceae bacterium]|jgi:hypothetical protein|nr:hypothetical protein [Beijerinckiaceae bacterium]
MASVKGCHMTVPFNSLNFSGTTIMKKIVLASLIALSFAAPALANHCPMDMKKIEAAMKTTMADDATKKKVMELYNKGKAEHESGNHEASMKDLGEAMKLLGI